MKTAPRDLPPSVLGGGRGSRQQPQQPSSAPAGGPSAASRPRYCGVRVSLRSLLSSALTAPSLWAFRKLLATRTAVPRAGAGRGAPRGNVSSVCSGEEAAVARAGAWHASPGRQRHPRRGFEEPAQTGLHACVMRVMCRLSQNMHATRTRFCLGPDTEPGAHAWTGVLRNAGGSLAAPAAPLNRALRCGPAARAAGTAATARLPPAAPGPTARARKLR